jgi:hypothetical protein
MFDVRCSMFDVRCSMFDVRFSIQLVGTKHLTPFTPSPEGEGDGG